MIRYSETPVDDTIKFSARDMNPRTTSAAAFADVDNGEDEFEFDKGGCGGAGGDT